MHGGKEKHNDLRDTVQFWEERVFFPVWLYVLIKRQWIRYIFTVLHRNNNIYLRTIVQHSNACNTEATTKCQMLSNIHYTHAQYLTLTETSRLKFTLSRSIRNCSNSLRWLSSWCSADEVHDSCGCEWITEFFQMWLRSALVPQTLVSQEPQRSVTVTMSTASSVLSARCLQRMNETLHGTRSEVRAWQILHSIKIKSHATTE